MRVDLGAEFVLSLGAKSVIILLLASAAVVTLRNSSAAVRHLVWSTTLVGLLALPMLVLVVPEWITPAIGTVVWPDLDRAEAPRAASHAAPALGAAAAQDISSAGVPSLALVPASEPARVAITRTPVTELGASSENALLGASVRSAAAVGILGALGGATWQSWLFLGWLGGALLIFAWIGVGYCVTWWLERSSRVVVSGPVHALVDELAEELDLRRTVTLLQTDLHTMPRTWGLRPKVLLPVDADDWSDVRLRTVLLHELAHIKRRDYLTQMLAHVAGALYWFNPLVWYASRRMRIERERACDDRVLNAGSKASDYAEHLLHIARSMKVSVLASATSVAMARRYQLSNRLLDLLDGERRRSIVSPKVAVVAWTVAAAVVIPVAGAASAPETHAENDGVSIRGTASRVTEAAEPAGRTENLMRLTGATPRRAAAGARQDDHLTDVQVVQQCDWYRRGANTATSMNVNDDLLQISIRMDDCQLSIVAVGEIEFDEAETDITYIAPDGMFEIEEREGRTWSRLRIAPTEGAALERRWFVDGEERSYDREAQEWFSGLLPLVFRRAGFQAEERAARLLKRDGVDGLLQEISLIPSDYTARKYFEVLLTQADLSEQQIREVVRQAGKEIDSDYELAELLIGMAHSHPVDEAVQVAYIEAAQTIDSDYETRRVLNVILDRPGLSAAVARGMLQLAMEIDSDYELAELLIGMLDRHPVEEALTPEFFAALGTLDSDYEHSRVLQAALQRGAPSRRVLDLALESASRLDSDYELAELLIQVGELYPTGQTIPDSYLGAARSIGSDHERRRVFSVLVERDRLSVESLEQLLDAAILIDSDYELAGLLVNVLEAYEFDGSTYEALFRAVSALDSDFERSRVLQTVLNERSLTDRTVELVLDAASSMDSDYELSTVLLKVVESHTLNERLRQIFIDVAGSISSEYERDRVLAMLVRNGGVD
jgi:beta-lactamase regulating signal transducer with metallopeptidase domain